jgi:hypothetical protein
MKNNSYNNICGSRVVQTASTITNTTIRVKDRDAKCEIQALNRTQYFMSKILDAYTTTTAPTYTYACLFVMTSTLVNKVQFLSHPAFFSMTLALTSADPFQMTKSPVIAILVYSILLPMVRGQSCASKLKGQCGCCGDGAFYGCYDQCSPSSNPPPPPPSSSSSPPFKNSSKPLPDMKKCNKFGTWTNNFAVKGGQKYCEEAGCTWLTGNYSGGSCISKECRSGNLDSEANALFGNPLGMPTTSIVVIGLSLGCFCLFLFQVRIWYLASKKNAEYEKELQQKREQADVLVDAQLVHSAGNAVKEEEGEEFEVHAYLSMCLSIYLSIYMYVCMCMDIYSERET